jgi:hypothetical protein
LPPPPTAGTGLAGYPFDPSQKLTYPAPSAGTWIRPPQAIRPTRLVTTAERFDEFLLAIDLWPESRDNKLKFLASLKDRWAKERTPPKESKWFNPDKYRQLDQATWAWEYLIRAKRACLIAPPSNQQELTAAVLASFDLFWRLSTAERTVFIEQMKRTWSQKKYRASDKAKKPYYLRLTRQSREKLAWLAKFQERKDTEILEDLIEFRYREVSSQKGVKL